MSKLIAVLAFPTTASYRIGKNSWDNRKTGNLDNVSKREFNELLAARDKLKSEFGLMDRTKIASTPKGKVAYENYQTLKKLIAEVRA